jgi:FkbM family methyltransferase
VLQYFLRDGDVLADIGANWGHHSFQAIKNKSVNVLAFEPIPLIVEDINRVAHDLNVEDKIQVFDCALSEKNGTTELIQNYFESGVASIEHLVFEKSKRGTISKLHQLLKLTPIKQLVQVRSFDSFEFSKLNFMKIDAEGAEIAILRGARDSINKFKPYICFEYHSGDLQGLSEFSNFFAGLDYVMYKINVEKDKISHFINRIFLTRLKKNNLKKFTQHNILAIHSSKTPSFFTSQ